MITNIIKNLIKDIPSVANSKFDSVQLLPIGNKVELKVKTPKASLLLPQLFSLFSPLIK